MNKRPILAFKLVAENVTLKQLGDLDTLLEQTQEMLLKQEVEGILVLVLHDVLNYHVQGPDLVALQGNVNSADGLDSFIGLVPHFVEDRVLKLHVRVFIVVEELLDNSAFEGQDLN